MKYLTILFVLVMLVGCGPTPEPVVYADDTGRHESCKWVEIEPIRNGLINYHTYLLDCKVSKRVCIAIITGASGTLTLACP